MVDTATRAETRDTSLNLHQRMLLAMDGIGYVPKEGTGPSSQGSYRYARHEAVRDVVREQLVRVGVMVHTSMEGRDIQVIEGKERSAILATVWGVLTFVNVDAPDDTFAVVIHGQGIDSQDKAVIKATTFAVKYGLINAFQIPTGDDPDAEGQDVPRERQASRPMVTHEDETPPSDDPSPLPGGICPAHGKPWTSGQYGWYCKAKNDDGSWCKAKPGAEWKTAHER